MFQLIHTYGEISVYKGEDIITQNIKTNLTKKYGEKSKPCIICGERIEIKGKTDMYCEECAKEVDKKKNKKRVEKHRMTKKV